MQDFTKRAQKDKVAVVEPADAQLVITVLSMGWDPNGETKTEVHRSFGGLRSTQEACTQEHMVVELKAGDYTTRLEGWRELLQSAEDQVGRELRRWLKDNAAKLQE